MSQEAFDPTPTMVELAGESFDNQVETIEAIKSLGVNISTLLPRRKPEGV